MPITVVINRDYDGATTCREVYAAGARYQIASSNLEIFSAKSQLLALYGSGNWLSVHVDDLQAPPQTAAEAAAAAINAAAVDAAAVDAAAVDAAAPAGVVEDIDLSPDFVAPDEAATEPRHTDDGDSGSGYEHPESDPGSIHWGASERMAARSPSMMPVVFKPRTYRAARDGATGKPEPTGAQWGAASQLRPVVFRAKTYRAARTTPPEEPTDSTDSTDSTDETDD